MTVHGNAAAWDDFERDLPETALLLGPGGVGKFTGAAGVAQRNAGVEDIVLYQNVTVGDMKELVEWLRFRSDGPKIAVLEPGGCHANVHAMLKTVLETLPPRTHVWVVDSYRHPVPPGIRDRTFHYQFGLLSEGEMSDFFAEAETMTLDRDYVVTLGSVDHALEMNAALQWKPAVANWIKAVEESNYDLLQTAAAAWGVHHTNLLVAELEAQLVGRSIVHGTVFRRVGKDRVLRALTRLQDGTDHGLSALTTGMLLMPS